MTCAHPKNPGGVRTIQYQTLGSCQVGPISCVYLDGVHMFPLTGPFRSLNDEGTISKETLHHQQITGDILSFCGNRRMKLP